MTDPTRAALEARPMTTAGLQAKFRLRKAWFEAHPNQPIPEGKAEVDALLAAVEQEARAALAQPAAPAPERCARCGHVHPAPPDPRKMPCVECDCWSHSAPSPQPAEALRDARERCLCGPPAKQGRPFRYGLVHSYSQP